MERKVGGRAVRRFCKPEKIKMLTKGKLCQSMSVTSATASYLGLALRLQRGRFGLKRILHMWQWFISSYLIICKRVKTVFVALIADLLKNWSCRFWKCSGEQLAAALTASSFLSSKWPISFNSSSLSLPISRSYAAICKKFQQSNLSWCQFPVARYVQAQPCNGFNCQWSRPRLWIFQTEMETSSFCLWFSLLWSSVLWSQFGLFTPLGFISLVSFIFFF